MRLSSRLIHNSQEAFLLSIELYNKPTIKYRLEAFCFLITNAWELLLKVKLISDARRSSVIFYRKARGERRRSLSLRHALKRVFPNENDPVRRNIEEIADLRDAGTHLCVPEMEPLYVGIFQAAILNYVKTLKEWNHIDVLHSATPPMLSLVVDSADIDPVVIQRRHGSEVLAFLQSTSERLSRLQSEIGNVQFSVPITHRVLITKKEWEADAAVWLSGSGNLAGTILEVPRDIQTLYPYGQKEAVPTIAERVQPVKFGPYEFQASIYVEKIKRSESEYHYYFKKTGTHLYSPKLVDLLVQRVRRRKGYLESACDKYKSRNAVRPRIK